MQRRQAPGFRFLVPCNFEGCAAARARLCSGRALYRGHRQCLPRTGGGIQSCRNAREHRGRRRGHGTNGRLSLDRSAKIDEPQSSVRSRERAGVTVRQALEARSRGSPAIGTLTAIAMAPLSGRSAAKVASPLGPEPEPHHAVAEKTTSTARAPPP
ncbi:uncharacterized protein K452DRAFT_158650 [Aplosporella prunicola CBS 121167]|uniref:Uncharacterized protein n=1 Tax=Aplosporella prunicola CBS 121167 TaxID=1176127 RepID=A0A6A6AV01_9PEZI|nr:uncharacterized protein K452DRAFT_158650 [Aplosporella prunicola CBS 121167]KAF2135852.1 hypothetical protein K452DRAFT_158650 [Aplosporella prunicola CBS 121167]